MSSRLIDITVPPNSHEVVNVPIKPLTTGRLMVRARPTDVNYEYNMGHNQNNNNRRGYLSATSNVIEEGHEVARSSVLLIDLTNRPYFVGKMDVPVPPGYTSRNELTMTGGVVGPIVSKFPANISSLINQPEVPHC